MPFSGALLLYCGWPAPSQTASISCLSPFLSQFDDISCWRPCIFQLAIFLVGCPSFFTSTMSLDHGFSLFGLTIFLVCSRHFGLSRSQNLLSLFVAQLFHQASSRLSQWRVCTQSNVIALIDWPQGEVCDSKVGITDGVQSRQEESTDSFEDDRNGAANTLYAHRGIGHRRTGARWVMVQPFSIKSLTFCEADTAYRIAGIDVWIRLSHLSHF